MPVVTDAEQARLEALEKRIAAAQAVQAPRPKPPADGHSQAQMAWRMVIELVAGLMIGFGIGYGLDTLLGTMPIFLVLFILAGFAAGVKTMLRSAKEMQAKGLADMDANAAPVADDEKDD
jgi:ATP synthase protein I